MKQKQKNIFNEVRNLMVQELSLSVTSNLKEKIKLQFKIQHV